MKSCFLEPISQAQPANQDGCVLSRLPPRAANTEQNPFCVVCYDSTDGGKERLNLRRHTNLNTFMTHAKKVSTVTKVNILEKEKKEKNLSACPMMNI